MKLSHHAAENLVKAWRADATIGQLDADVIAELHEKIGFVPFEVRVQVMLGCAKITTEHLWAGEFQAAIATIQKYGVSLRSKKIGPSGVKVGSAVAQKRADNRAARRKAGGYK